jgi:hypothetical protein
MKTKLLASFALIVGLVMACSPLFAHHGSRISYDLTKPITMKGTVTSFEWQNPHVFLSYDVKDASGKVTNWGIELAENPRMLMTTRGWTKETLKPGDEVTATLFASKAGTPRGILSKLTFNDKQIYENTMRGPE